MQSGMGAFALVVDGAAVNAVTFYKHHGSSSQSADLHHSYHNAPEDQVCELHRHHGGTWRVLSLHGSLASRGLQKKTPPGAYDIFAGEPLRANSCLGETPSLHDRHVQYEDRAWPAPARCRRTSGHHGLAEWSYIESGFCAHAGASELVKAASGLQLQ